MTQSVEQRIAELLDAIPTIESSARQLQRSKDPVADDAAVQSGRDEYLSWYARCLTVVPDNLQAKFKDFYEGGSFVRRIRHFLEAPTQPNSLVAADPPLASNPLVPHWANAFENTFVPSLLGQRQILQQSLEAARSSVGPGTAAQVDTIRSATLGRLCDTSGPEHLKDPIAQQAYAPILRRSGSKTIQNHLEVKGIGTELFGRLRVWSSGHQKVR